MFFRVLHQLFLFCIAISAFYDVECASTSKKPSSITTATPLVKSGGVSNSPKQNTTGRIITTRVGDTNQQCQCVLFYLCDAINVVELPNDGENCGENIICCRLPVNPDGVPSDPTPTSSGNIQSSNSYSTSPPYVPSNTGSSEQQCVCVPPDQCIRTQEEEKDGIGVINPRIPFCSQEQLCCERERVRQNPSSEPNPYTETPIPFPTVSETPIPFPIPSETPIPFPTPSAPLCGVRNFDVNNRITGTEVSKNTSFGEFPWMAVLFTSSGNENVFVCGASLLSTTVVLTAAHCIQTVERSILRVRVGEYDTSARGSSDELLPHQERNVNQIIQHPNFHPTALRNDLALVIVDRPFEYARHISPICIPLQGSEFTGQGIYNPNLCVATGWGKAAFNSDQFHTTLKKVDLTLVVNDECERQLRGTRLGPHFILDPSFVCAGGQPGYDTCEGDGGGPLVCALTDNPNRYVQVGIVSWGIGCGGNIPAAYASLEANAQWLTETYDSTASLFDTTNRFGVRINANSNSSSVSTTPKSTTAAASIKNKPKKS